MLTNSPGSAIPSITSGKSVHQRDRALVQRIKQGDRAAFEALFRAYAAPLCQFVYRYVACRQVAEDLVQDLFLHIWQQREIWNVPRSVSSYLYRAARNRALDQLKHENVVERWRDEVYHNSDMTADSADTLLRTGEVTMHVQTTIASLPERCRIVFILSRWHGLSYREISQVMQISVKTVETQMSRAFDKLRKGLMIYEEDLRYRQSA